MKKIVIMLVFTWAYLPLNIAYAEKLPQTDKEKFSYAVGVQLAQNIIGQNIQIDRESFIQAIRDVLSLSGLKLSADEMQQILVTYQKEQIKIQAEAAENNKKVERQFLTTNKEKKDVVELPSGLQYKILEKGIGEKPTINDTVLFHFSGKLLSGKEFDNTYAHGKPISVPLRYVIKGWQEALTMMGTGSKWQIYVPAKLAYGQQGRPPLIQPNSALIFDIELISIN